MLKDQVEMKLNMKQKLQYLRMYKDLTQKQLGDRLGIDAATITRFEKGERVPSTNQLLAYADFFGISVDYLTDDENRRFYLATVHVSGVITEDGIKESDGAVDDIEAFVPPYVRLWDTKIFLNKIKDETCGIKYGDFVFTTDEIPFCGDTAFARCSDGEYDYVELVITDDGIFKMANFEYEYDCSEVAVMKRVLCSIGLPDK